MGKFKYYRYGVNEKGKYPQKYLIKVEESKEGFCEIAIYNRLLRDQLIRKYKLIDLNAPVKKLTKFRNSFGMKQRELAELAGVPLRTIQGWEYKGMNSAGLANAIKIADILECDVRDLLEDE